MPQSRLWLLLLLAGLAPPASAQEPFDVLIVGGHVLDGTGNPWFRADIGVRGGRIVAVGALGGASAARTVDARGRLIVPGFIDIHSHADDPLRTQRGLRSADAGRRAAPNLVSQGITTVVVNQDGRSPRSIAAQRAGMTAGGIGPNAILLVGHGSVRRAVMGDDVRRPATGEEIRRMRALVREGMDAGAAGLSAGLEYVPGRWSTTDEVVALVEETVPFGGIYISHERSEGADPMWWVPSRGADPPPPSLLDAVAETIEIGERTGAVVVASHIKAKGEGYWGTSAEAIRLIADARARGVRVYADQYPYTTSGSDGNTVLVPDWVFAESGDGASNGERDHATALRAVLARPDLTRTLRTDIAHELARRGGARNVMVFEARDSAIVGQTIADLSAAGGMTPVDVVITLQLEGDPRRRGGVRLRGFSMAEPDVEAYARQSWVATASDAGIVLPSDGPVHARYYGTFPRKLHRYALERGVISLEQAVRSATSLPAQILGLQDRGLIRVGQWADLAVLDLDALRDNATFFEPHQHSSGIVHVLVNGVFVVDGGVGTGALPGVIVLPGRTQ